MAVFGIIGALLAAAGIVVSKMGGEGLSIDYEATLDRPSGRKSKSDSKSWSPQIIGSTLLTVGLVIVAASVIFGLLL